MEMKDYAKIAENARMIQKQKMRKQFRHSGYWSEDDCEKDDNLRTYIGRWRVDSQICLTVAGI